MAACRELERVVIAVSTYVLIDFCEGKILSLLLANVPSTSKRVIVLFNVSTMLDTARAPRKVVAVTVVAFTAVVLTVSVSINLV